MADVFISYSKAERALTEALADDLEAVGVSVWWDTSLLPGESFRDVIMRELGAARAVIVIWTQASVRSDWVYSEANRARLAKKLVALKDAGLDVHLIPPPFDAIHTDLVENRASIFAALERLGLILDKKSTEDVSPLDEQEREAVHWLEIRQSADEERFRKFLDEFPSGNFTSKAFAKVDNIAWTKVLVQNSLRAFEGYIKDFPSGAFFSAAKAQIAILTRERIGLASEGPGVIPQAPTRTQVDFGALRSVHSEALQKRDPAASLTSVDDLKRIRGIGVLIERKLNSMGIHAYGQISAWTQEDIDRVSQVLDFRGRIERENWVEQARILNAGGMTEFSRRLDRGDG